MSGSAISVKAGIQLNQMIEPMMDSGFRRGDGLLQDHPFIAPELRDEGLGVCHLNMVRN